MRPEGLAAPAPAVATPSRSSLTTRLAGASVLVSAGLTLALAYVYIRFHSQLAFAQAADSVSDVGTGVALAYAVRVASDPADEEHPAGHHRAEPIAALLVAVMAGVLGVEVARGAVLALADRAQPILEWPLAAAFAAKVVAKGAIAGAAARGAARAPSPGLRALRIDSRNDVAVGLLALLGFYAARRGWPALDAWLALPVAAWIGYGGVALARENLRLLMGAAVDGPRRAALEATARAVPGVRDTHRFRAVFHGTAVDVRVDIVVDPELSVREAHHIGHAVERALLAQPDVCHAEVHVDVEDDLEEPEER